MPRDGELVWIKLREGEGFWQIGAREGGKWWISGKQNTAEWFDNVAGWQPFR